MEDKLTRMKELIELLNKASKLYYQENTSMMTDFEYDRLYDELVKLESETNTVLENSPTINVEPESTSSSLTKVEHPSPMLSLGKTKSVDDLVDFIGDEEGLLSWKLDGLTIVLTYDNGFLTSGVTRGNGTIGELVTENVKQFRNVPLTIPYKGHLVLRGEAVIKYSDFKRMNEEAGDGSTQYKNPRNLCSGSVRQLDSKVTYNRCVNCIIFALIESDNKFELKSEAFAWLKNQGFEVVEHFKVNKENIPVTVEKYKELILDYDIPSDGLVLTFDNIKYGNSLGSTAKAPKHSIAFKWKDETVATTLREIDWMVSRTGLINPVAVFDPIELEGTIVSRASVHNVSILKGLHLGIGDTINVYKANMIIPQIGSNDTQSDNVHIPDTCPVCGGKTQIIENTDVQYLYCTNEFCVAKLIKRLSLFVSRNAMNIDGISDAILSRLIDEGLVRSYTDLYHLDKYKEQIINFDGFGEKSYNNMIASIEKSRNVKLANFIYALGIPDIGFSRAKLICNECNNDFDKVCKLTYEDLSSIEGVGDIIAKEWIDEFNNESFINELDQLKKEIILPEPTVRKDGVLTGKSFVITGSLNHFDNRDSLVEYIENNGGKVVKAISNNVSFLINNDITSTSTKNKKAKELNIPIISEEELIKMIEG